MAATNPPGTDKTLSTGLSDAGADCMYTYFFPLASPNVTSRAAIVSSRPLDTCCSSLGLLVKLVVVPRGWRASPT